MNCTLLQHNHDFSYRGHFNTTPRRSTEDSAYDHSRLSGSPRISSQGPAVKETSTSGRYYEVDDTEGDAITLQASTTTRDRSLAAALLGVLALLASLFVGPAATAQAAAAPTSTASTVRGVAPLAYLRDVLSRLPTMTTSDDLGALLPCNWKPQG